MTSIAPQRNPPLPSRIKAGRDVPPPASEGSIGDAPPRELGCPWRLPSLASSKLRGAGSQARGDGERRGVVGEPEPAKPPPGRPAPGLFSSRNARCVAVALTRMLQTMLQTISLDPSPCAPQPLNPLPRPRVLSPPAPPLSPAADSIRRQRVLSPYRPRPHHPTVADHDSVPIVATAHAPPPPCRPRAAAWTAAAISTPATAKGGGGVLGTLSPGLRRSR